jgi:hypothetical protein
MISGRKHIQRYNLRPCRAADWLKTRRSVCHLLQSSVTNFLTEIFDSVLTDCPPNSSENRHAPCVTRFMRPVKDNSAKLNSHYGINWGGTVCFNKVAVMKESSFLNGRYIPALTAYEYRGYIISAWARPESENGFTAVGIIYERGQFGSIIQVQRIEGALFETKEQAEQHGLRLCKEWIDKQKPEFRRRVG